MRITINGTEKQLTEFFKSLFREEELESIVKLLAEHNLLFREDSSDNDQIYEAIDSTRWDTGFHLLHLLFNGEENDIGRFISYDDLKNLVVGPDYRVHTEREISNRFAGLSKITNRLKSPELFKIRTGKEKRYIMPPEVVSTFEQYFGECLEDEDTMAQYQEELESHNLSMPAVRAS